MKIKGIHVYILSLYPVAEMTEGQTGDFLLYTDNKRQNVFLSDLLGRNETGFLPGLKNPIACDYDHTIDAYFVLERGAPIQSSEKSIVVHVFNSPDMISARLPGRKYT